jgi:GNAT superfamily N-acetyltransferase
MSESYVSWGIDEEPIYDEEGEEIDAEEYARIDLVYVAPEERGQGRALPLLSQAIEEIRSARPGLPIRLVVLPKEEGIEIEGLVRLYERAGFEVTGTAGDTIIMEM